jgi:hypothetical protein
MVIALDRVGADFYTNWQGRLPGARADADMMMELLGAAGFAAVSFINEQATRAAITQAFADLRDSADPGDLVVVYFSGHGTTMPDLNGDEPQDGVDEVWCLHDGMFVDDERDACLTQFAEGVRVVVIADSCFSGDEATKQVVTERQKADRPLERGLRSKLAPGDIGERVYEVQRDYYNPILNRPAVFLELAPASVLLLSACGEDELARYGDEGSVFTRAIVDACRGGAFDGTYDELHAAVAAEVTARVPTQHPQIIVSGLGARLDRERVFS